MVMLKDHLEPLPKLSIGLLLPCDQPRFYRRKNSIAHSDVEKNLWLELKSTPNLAIYGAKLRPLISVFKFNSSGLRRR
jgi:hypothetical protein